MIEPVHPYKIVRMIIVFLFICLVASSLSFAGEIAGNISVESSIFLKESLYDDQKSSNESLSGQIEYFQEWDEGNQNLIFAPYFRIDSTDEKRTKIDFRELYWVTIHPSWELYLGIRTVFWGITESQHLVDIINQTDLVDDPSGEEKLGQPMVNLSIVNDLGTFDFFVMPFFRERPFPGEDSRFRLPLKVDVDNPEYESEDENQHIDYAARSYHSIDDLEMGFSLFSGTNRTPNLKLGIRDNEPVLVLQYELIQQAGLELQWIVSDWIFKLESITRQHKDLEASHSTDIRYSAYTAGFEYTWANIKETGIDWGALFEYLYDDRGDEATTPFEQDIFVGTRITLNDEQSTDLLIGVISDTSHSTQVGNLSGSRRVGEDFKVIIEGQFFMDVDEDDLLFNQRRNDFLQFELSYFF